MRWNWKLLSSAAKVDETPTDGVSPGTDAKPRAGTARNGRRWRTVTGQGALCPLFLGPSSAANCHDAMTGGRVWRRGWRRSDRGPVAVRTTWQVRLRTSISLLAVTVLPTALSILVGSTPPERVSPFA